MDGIMDGINAALGVTQPAAKSNYSSHGRYDSMYADAGNKYGVDPALIKAVAITESSENHNAISRDANHNPIAHGLMQFTPATARGIGLNDPYDPAQSIEAGAKLLKQNIDASGGDTNKALLMYHGGTNQSNWGPKTKAYPTTVMSHMPKTEQSQDDDPDSIMGGINAAMKTPDGYVQKIPDKSVTPVSGVKNQYFNANSGNKFLKGVASVGDTLLNTIPNVENTLAYATRRALGDSPTDATNNANTTTDWMKDPLGKAFHITNDADYKGEGSKYTLNKLGELVAPAINKATNAVSQATGLPIDDVRNMAQSLSFSAPKIISNSGKAVFSKIQEAQANGTLPKIYSNTAQKNGAVSQSNDATGVHQGAAEIQSPLDQRGGTKSIPEPTERSLNGGGAASVEHNPYPVLTGEETARGRFPTVKLSKIAGDVSPQEQAIKANIATDILGDVNRVRTGVITGNEDTLRTEHTLAAAANPTPEGLVLKQQIAAEQQALSNYAKDRVDATGANPRLINDEQRGNATNDIFHSGDENGLKGYINNAKQSLFDYAKKTVGDNPVQTIHSDAHLNDAQTLAGAEMSGHNDVISGAKRLLDLAKNVGFRDPISKEIHPPGSISALHAVTKAINRSWTPEKAATISDINKSIWQDISASGGDGLYELGNKVHETEKTLMGSKGIKSVFSPVDENGVSVGLSPDKILSKLNNLPMDQFRHIHNVIEDLSNGKIRGAPEGMPAVPQALIDSAKSGLSEIHGSLARAVHEAGGSKAGVWNQNSVNHTLNSTVGDKIYETFPPEEIAKFHTLNYGGQQMPGIHSYEGGAQQARRMDKAGLLETMAPKVLTEAGALTHIPGMATFGANMGEKYKNRAYDKRHLELGKKLDAQFEANAKLGKKKL